jgi:hypothetical protein
MKKLLSFREKRGTRTGATWLPKIMVALKPVIILVAVGWIIFAFNSYLPSVIPSRSIDFYLRRTGAYDVVLVLWFAAVAYCMGRRLLRLIGVAPTAGSEEATFSFAAGAAIFSWTTMILSLVHGLYRPVAYVLILVPSLIWIHELRQLPGRVCRSLMSAIKSLSWTPAAIGRAFIGVYIASVLGVILISALGPSYEYDDVVYHLTGPKNFILAHKLVPLPDVPLVFFPKNIEMLHTLGMLWHNDITSKLIVFLCGCMTIAGVYSFSARFHSRATGTLAVAILASSPLFIWEMKTAHNDIGLTMFLFAGVYATIVWLRTREKSWFRLACLFLAFSLGAKYWAIPALGIIILLAFITMLLQSQGMRSSFGNAFKLGLCSSLGLLPWGIINFYFTGNPVFPLLNDFFRSPYWTSGHTNMAMGEMFQGGIRITFANWWDLFRLPWEMMVDSRARFGGNIGPWYVIFIPFLLLFHGMGLELGFLFAAAALYFIAWAIYGPWVRFVMPALPGLAVGAAFACERLLEFLGSFRRAFAITGAVVLSVLAVLSSPLFESGGSWSRYGNPPLDTWPIKYLSGKESKNEYLRRFYGGYRAVEFLNRIPGEKKVLYVHAMPDGFYLKGKAAFHYSPYLPGLVGADADQIHRTLRRHGITHVVVEQLDQDSSPMSSRESDFTHWYLRKLFQRNIWIVYELLATRVDQPVVVYDFLDHLDQTRAAQLKPGTTGSAQKGVRPISDDYRYAMITVPPSEVEFLVKIPDRAILSFAAAREDPGHTGKGSVQVWISTSESEQHMVYSRDLEGNIQNWIENEVDLSLYAGRRVAVTLRTEEPSPSCNYFWADPVLIAPSTDIQVQKTSEEQKGASDAGLAILSGRVSPDQVRRGESIEVSFSGPALAPETYFDILYRGPGNLEDQTALNYQQGSKSRHTVIPATPLGTWIITGARAHSRELDHTGSFHPLWMPFNVTPAEHSDK